MCDKDRGWLLPDESPLDSRRSLNYADARNLQDDFSSPPSPGNKLVCPWCKAEYLNTTTDVVECECGAMAHILIGDEPVWVKMDEAIQDQESEVEDEV